MSPRTLAWVSTGFAVILGIVAANLWRGLRAERELTAALRTQLAGSTAGQTRVQLPASGLDTGRVLQPQTSTSPATVATTREAGINEQELLQDPEYRKARLQADGYAAALERDGAPLESAQTRAIAMALSAEQKSLKQDIVALARTVDLSNPQTQQDAQYALKRRQSESGQRVLDAVYPVLGPQQMYLLREQIEQQEVNRAAASAQQRAR